MKKMFLVFSLFIVTSAAFAQNPKLIHPPTDDPRASWTIDSVDEIAAPYFKQKLVELGIEPEGTSLVLLPSERWGDYVNHHHFVDLQAEGVPPGYQFDYSWKKEAFWEVPNNGRPRPLPSAEIVETGAFYFWWEKYNYYGWNREKTVANIQAIIDHELYHYLQWKRIAGNVLVMGGFVKNMTDKHAPVLGIKIPNTLQELEDQYGQEAVNQFMNVWTDPAHYQCREVEVYSTQIEKSQLNRATDEDYFAHLLQNLRTYAYGDKGSAYSVGCTNSMWASEFTPYIQKAKKQLSDNASFLSAYEAKKK